MKDVSLVLFISIVYMYILVVIYLDQPLKYYTLQNKQIIFKSRFQKQYSHGLIVHNTRDENNLKIVSNIKSTKKV